MNATAANLMERVLPQTGLRQRVLSFPFPWRRRLAQDGALFGRLTRVFVKTVQAFYAERAARESALGAKTGAVTVVQKTSSDFRLNRTCTCLALDGAWREQDGELCWQGLGHLKTSEVGAVLESTVRRIERHLRRAGLLGIDQDGADPDVACDPESNLAASAVSGQTLPAGPQWLRGLAPLEPHALAYDKPLCASLEGFTLHAATRASALDPAGRKALLRLGIASASRAGAPPAAPRRSGAHHPEEGLQRRNGRGRGRHGPAVAAVPPGQRIQLDGDGPVGERVTLQPSLSANSRAVGSSMSKTASSWRRRCPSMFAACILPSRPQPSTAIPIIARSLPV